MRLEKGALVRIAAALALTVGLMPAGAFAADNGNEATPPQRP